MISAINKGTIVPVARAGGLALCIDYLQLQ